MAEYDTLDNLNRMSADDKLALAHERWACTEEAYGGRNQRDREVEDRRFLSGEQWTAEERRMRSGLPCLVMNRLQGSVGRVINETKLLRPMVHVVPQDSSADVETAKVLQGIIRNAEVTSDSDDAYETATSAAAIGGRGFFRLYIYANPRTLYDELRWQRIRNPLAVRPDPNAQQLDYSDMQYCFVGAKRVSEREFRTLWPDKDVPRSHYSFEHEWVTDDGIRICEYYYREKITVQRVRYQGRVYDVDRLPAGAVAPDAVTVEDWRVWHCYLGGHEILQENEFPSEWIPVIPILGEELEVGGETHYTGVVRNAKDPQRYYNYNKSRIAETIGLAPKAPYVMAEGQDVGYEHFWRQANQQQYPYLLYKPTTHEGHLVPPPQRSVYEPPIQALVAETMQAANDIDVTTRVYEAARGAPSNEQSGRAIANRSQQSEISNLHFGDNQARAVRHAGRIAIQVIQALYTTPQVVRILGEDDTEEWVQINQEFERQGQTILHDLSLGCYDVVADAGPSYKTRRQEAVAGMIDLTKVAPQLFQIIGDKLIAAMDIPEAREMAERLRKTIPAELLADEQLPDEEALRQQLRQAGQMIEGLNAFGQEQQQLVQVLTEQLQAMQQQMSDKSRELDRKDRELAWRMEKESQEVDLKEDAQNLDEAEFAWKASQGGVNGRD